ncbi:hypothetical protein Efla_001962 [Eimeria flavescens]
MEGSEEDYPRGPTPSFSWDSSPASSGVAAAAAGEAAAEEAAAASAPAQGAARPAAAAGNEPTAAAGTWAAARMIRGAVSRTMGLLKVKTKQQQQQQEEQKQEEPLQYWEDSQRLAQPAAALEAAAAPAATAAAERKAGGQGGAAGERHSKPLLADLMRRRASAPSAVPFGGGSPVSGLYTGGPPSLQPLPLGGFQGGPPSELWGAQRRPWPGRLQDFEALEIHLLQITLDQLQTEEGSRASLSPPTDPSSLTDRSSALLGPTAAGSPAAAAAAAAAGTNGVVAGSRCFATAFLAAEGRARGLHDPRLRTVDGIAGAGGPHGQGRGAPVVIFPDGAPPIVLPLKERKRHPQQHRNGPQGTTAKGQEGGAPRPLLVRGPTVIGSSIEEELAAEGGAPDCGPPPYGEKEERGPHFRVAAFIKGPSGKVFLLGETALLSVFDPRLSQPVRWPLRGPHADEGGAPVGGADFFCLPMMGAPLGPPQQLEVPSASILQKLVTPLPAFTLTAGAATAANQAQTRSRRWSSPSPRGASPVAHSSGNEGGAPSLRRASPQGPLNPRRRGPASPSRKGGNSSSSNRNETEDKAEGDKGAAAWWECSLRPYGAPASKSPPGASTERVKGAPPSAAASAQGRGPPTEGQVTPRSTPIGSGGSVSPHPIQGQAASQQQQQQQQEQQQRRKQQEQKEQRLHPPKEPQQQQQQQRQRQQQQDAEQQRGEEQRQGQQQAEDADSPLLQRSAASYPMASSGSMQGSKEGYRRERQRGAPAAAKADGLTPGLLLGAPLQQKTASRGAPPGPLPSRTRKEAARKKQTGGAPLPYTSKHWSWPEPPAEPEPDTSSYS